MLSARNMLTPATASSTASAFVDTPSVSPKPWGPSFSIPSKTGTSAVIDLPVSVPEALPIPKGQAVNDLPVSVPEALPIPKDQASDIEQKMQSNIVLAPQTVDSPVTKPNKPAGGVPLAQPVDAKALEQQRRQKGLKPGDNPIHVNDNPIHVNDKGLIGVNACLVQGYILLQQLVQCANPGC